MHRWRSISFLLILAVGSSIAEAVQNAQEYSTLPESERLIDTGLDYESALRPAVLQKRSIGNIARLLLGGNVPPNHPLVKYPEPKTWNLASNIVAALPEASTLSAAESSTSEGWERKPSSTLQNIQQLFETKAKIIPYTGQVATGLTGLASVKGDLIRQIHSISTQAIAQAAAEAAARALASAAAAHAVTNSIAHSVSPGAQTGIKGGWSSYQNTYAQRPGKTPGEQPGPPYHDSSAHINHYQAPPAAYNPYAVPATTPAPILPAYPPRSPQRQPPTYQNNGYYTLYNTQPSTDSAHEQTPYTSIPPQAHARPTMPPNTLIATTPSGYSPSLSKPLIPSLRNGKSLPVIIYTPCSNNTPLTSFRRAAPAGIFGRNTAQPSSASSLLSTISSLLATSTKFNAAYGGIHPGGIHPNHQQRPSAILSNLLSPTSSAFPATQPVLRPTAAAPSLLSSGIGSSAYGDGYPPQSVNPLSQIRGNYGGFPSSGSTGYLQHPAGNAYPTEARSASVNTPGYSFNQHGTGHVGANYAQSGANPYASQSIQSPPQFSSGPPRTAAATVANGGVGTSGYESGSGYTGYNGGAGSSLGHASGWNTQHAGPSASASTWPGSNLHTPGYAGQAPGNVNNSPGSFGGSPPAQFPVTAGSSFPQQTYSALSANAYQPSTANAYAQTQQVPFPQQPSQFNNGFQTLNSNANSIGGIRNSDITHRFDSHDQRPSASIMGNDDYDEDSKHDSYQPTQKRSRPPPKNSYSSSRHPSPMNKRPYKRPHHQSQSSSQKNNPHNTNNNGNHHHNNNKQGNNVRKDVGGNGNKAVILTGNKKGSHFDSSLDTSVDSSVDDYYVEGADSDDIQNFNNKPDTNKNRWRTKNPSGQRPNSFHNHNSNGRWNGKTPHTNQAPPKNVRGNGRGSDRSRTQPGKPKGGPGKKHRNKKVQPSNERDERRKQPEKGKPKPEPTHPPQRRVRPKQQKQQQKTQYKSRDVYTTLPQYVFRVGERPDVFLRPGGKRKQGISLRGVLHPRVGETDGSGSSLHGSPAKEENLHTAASSHPYSETFPGESYAEKDLEESADSTGSYFDTGPGGSEDEQFVSASREDDETARDDVLSDQVASDTGFITSEEFDPEEREAFVDAVYAEEQGRRNRR